MAALDRPREQNGDLSSYTTTYARTYYAPPGPAGCAERPGSSHAFQAPYRLSGPIGSTTYGSEFYRKGQRKAEPIRTGTASGNRRNNPHPLETFMNWKLPPRPMAEQNYSDWGIELTDEVMDKVCRGQLASTYQTDYLGIPQGYQVKHALGTTIPSDWKSRVTYSLDSSMRNSYRPPCQKKELKGNMKRYGCNKLKNTPAHGVVPTVSTRQMNIKSRTSYERDFITPANAHVRFDTKDVRDLARKHGANAILKYFKNADGKGTEELTRMLDAMNIHPPTGSRPVTSTDPRSRVKTPTSSYHSTWLGPM